MFTAIRIASIGAVIALRAVLVEETYLAIFFAFLFAHYTLAAVYARKQIAVIARAEGAWLPLATLAAVVTHAVRTFQPGLVYAFGVHNALTDAYTTEQRPTAPPPALSAARALLGIAAYVMLLRGDDEIAAPIRAAAPVLLTLAGGGFAVLCVRARDAMPARMIVDVVAFEVVGIAACVLLSVHAPTLQDAIFYHLVFWLLFPIAQRRSAPRAIVGYLAATLVLTLAFLALTPLGAEISPIYFSLVAWHLGAQVFGYAHIAMTFAVSPSNPRWIRALFAGAPPVP